MKSIHVDEAVQQTLRPSLLHYRWRILGFLLLLLAAFFLLYPLQTFGPIGWVAFILLIAISAAGLARISYIWYNNVYVLTNQRMIDIDQQAVFSKHVAECPLEQIQDVRYEKSGIIASIFDIGTVIVDSGSISGHIELVDVRSPDAIKERIMNAQRHHIKKDGETQEI